MKAMGTDVQISTETENPICNPNDWTCRGQGTFTWQRKGGQKFLLDSRTIPIHDEGTTHSADHMEHSSGETVADHPDCVREQEENETWSVLDRGVIGTTCTVVEGKASIEPSDARDKERVRKPRGRDVNNPET